MYDLFLPICFDIDKCFPLSGWTLYCIDINRRFILHFDFSFQNATPPAVDNDINFMCTIPYTIYDILTPIPYFPYRTIILIYPLYFFKEKSECT